MVNIFKMNVFRLKKSRLAYIMLFMTLGLSLMFFGLEWLMQAALEGISDTINPMPGMEAPGNNVWVIVRSSLAYGAVPMGAVMGCLLFFLTEVSTGYVKNLVGYEANKHRLAVANLLTAALYAAVLLLVTVLFMLVMTLIGYEHLTFDGFGKFFVWLVVAYAEILAFVMLMQMLADATGRAIPFLIVGGLYPIVAMSLYQLIDLGVMYIKYKLGLGELGVGQADAFAVEKYTLLGGLTSFDLSGKWSGLVLSGIIAAVVLVGAYFLDVAALRKREIK